jgi:hypothetical protein
MLHRKILHLEQHQQQRHDREAATDAEQAGDESGEGAQ